MAIVIKTGGFKPSAGVRSFGFGADAATKKVLTPFIENKPPPKPTSVKVSSKAKINSNYIRGKVFTTTSRKMSPDNIYISRYERFLSETYVKVLRKQLNIRFRYAAGTHKNVGYATGNLSKSIKSDTKINIIRHRGMGRININYSLQASYNDYGDFLKVGRSPSVVPFWAIKSWIKTKIAQGSFRIKFKTEKGRSGKQRITPDQETRINSVAFAIRKKFIKEGRQPVLKDWSDYDKNERLRLMFDREIKSKGAYHRTQIRKSIIRNINK